MKDKIAYILESPERATEFIVIVLLLLACLGVLTVTYGWAGLVLSVAVPVVAGAVSYLIRNWRR